MVKCCYANCFNQKRQAGGLSYFQVPKDHRRQIWMTHGSVPTSGNVSPALHMCEEHFYEKDKKLTCYGKVLDKSALPMPPHSNPMCTCNEEAVDPSCSRVMLAHMNRMQRTSTITSGASNPAPTFVAPPLRTSRPKQRLLPPPLTPPPHVSAEPFTPASLVNLADTTSQTYVRDYSLPSPNFAVAITPSQFPSPGKYTYEAPPKEAKRKLPIPRRIFDTPKRLKNDPDYQIMKVLDNHMDEGYTQELKTFIYTQLLHKPNSPWETEEKNLFLKFYYKSPSLYMFMLDSGFKLPATSTIYRWHSELRLFAGMNKNVMDMLTDRAKHMTSLDRKCVVLFDEMAIKRELEYNFKDDIIYGFTDFGELGRQDKIASKVMVFTLRGLNKNWKQTICYYVGSPKGELVSEMIVLVATAVIKCGLNVVATSCDQGGANVFAYKKLMKSVNEPWIDIEEHRVFLLHDYPHLFKSVRNILLKHTITIEEDKVSWDVLRKVFEKDNNSTFRVLCKLSMSHIQPGPYEKLSVKLATQVFSAKVAYGIKCAMDCFESEEEKKWLNPPQTS